MKRLLIFLSMLAAGQAALAQPWSLTKIVDSKTVIPGGTEKFDGPTSFQYVSVYGDRVAFRGMSKSASTFGIYEWQAGVGRVVANQDTIVPGGQKKIEVFEHVNATSRGLTFGGASRDNVGIFYDDGQSLGHVVDQHDDMPGLGSKFVAVTYAHHSVGTSSVFGGFNSQSGGVFGIYRSDDGVLSRIADKTMSPPGHAELFNRFDDWGIDGQNTYFTAETSGYQCIIKNTFGSFTTIVDTTMSLSDGERSRRSGAFMSGVAVLCSRPTPQTTPSSWR